MSTGSGTQMAHNYSLTNATCAKDFKKVEKGNEVPGLEHLGFRTQTQKTGKEVPVNIAPWSTRSDRFIGPGTKEIQRSRGHGRLHSNKT